MDRIIFETRVSKSLAGSIVKKRKNGKSTAAATRWFKIDPVRADDDWTGHHVNSQTIFLIELQRTGATADMQDQTIEEFWAKIEKSFRPERAAGVDAEIELDLEGGEAYTMLIRDQKISGRAGKAAHPALVLRASAADLQAIFQGRMDPTSAFFRGNLAVEGDMRLAMRLVSFFK